MVSAIAFQTRARTIDHLGREQIADVPTAISELWKNAYDAYARQVALHIYEGLPPTAMIADDGHGMSMSQFIESWLVVGTESKAAGALVAENLRQGLSERPKQGQKGIGRLSVAALGSAVLVLSKQRNNNFVACLVDWRLFENPYVFLQDIRLPVVEFSSREDLKVLLPQLRASIVENLSPEDGNPDRAERLRDAWRRFDEHEVSQDARTLTTSTQIKTLAELTWDVELQLGDWPVWSGACPAGTALVMFDLNSALTAWVPGQGTVPSDAQQSSRASLVRTLSGFSDPYDDQVDDVLDYKVIVHTATEKNVVVGREAGYGIGFLHSLDHVLEGAFDEEGIFHGRVKAFGKDIGKVELTPPQLQPTSSKDRIGAFSLVIGAFEPVARSSILRPEIHASVVERAQTHSGLSIYRDGLRVMPYGRPENDFFKIEERRQSQAGREFWANRRLFGRIAISRAANPNLRDKAGREGLIDNTASRAIQILMIELLKVTARRYFGGDSPVRKELLPAIEAENDAAAEAAKKTQSRQLAGFRQIVREQSARLDVALAKSKATRAKLDVAVDIGSANAVWNLNGEVDELVSERASLRVPPKPKKLGKFEDVYRDYRDRYAEMAAHVDGLRELWTEAASRLNAKPAIDVARSQLSRNQKAITDQLGKWRREIETLLRSEFKRIGDKVDEDAKEYYKETASLLKGVEAAVTPLRVAIEEMDQTRERLFLRFSEVYEPYHRAMKQLSEGLDLDGALAYAAAHGDTLERRLEQVQSLAQVGISVEILSHELHTLDRRLAASLEALPESVRGLSAFQTAEAARKELVERLRFLSQMQIAGGDTREKISGIDIEIYLVEFFGPLLSEQGITLRATDAFSNAAFFEFPSRIFPVFINLVNNAIYWVSELTGSKEILLSAGHDTLMVSDNGRGIDPEDIPSLFELFFSRRTRGRGVGLYLCRQTLAAGGHKIDYVVDQAKKELSGANFEITLRSGFDA
ncbi:ATP-binding protein [Polaromonas aquatica]|uniref:histidine kinase n=1 Tax=Polaromonas aquatica TaxID=332657 RepID=A0ABW1TX48_9BURK